MLPYHYRQVVFSLLGRLSQLLLVFSLQLLFVSQSTQWIANVKILCHSINKTKFVTLGTFENDFWKLILLAMPTQSKSNRICTP